MLEIETLGLNHFERFVNGWPIASEGPVVSESNDALWVNDDGRRAVDVLGMNSKCHRAGAVRRSYLAGRIAQVRPPDASLVLLLEGFFREPVFGIDFFPNHQPAAIEIMAFNRSDSCIRLCEVFFHADEVIELSVENRTPVRKNPDEYHPFPALVSQGPRVAVGGSQ